MPLLTVNLVAGRTPEQITTLLDTIHASVVEAFEAPETDRYQIVREHPESHFLVQDTGLGLERSRDVVLIEITSRPRTREQKQTLYRLLAQRLNQGSGVEPHDLIVTITENTDEDWSFGLGRAQFLTGEL